MVNKKLGGALAVLVATIGQVHAELIMVQTLTRHGERAPDSIITESCGKVFPSLDVLVKQFEAFPGRLTPLGVQTMREVGEFVRERYIEGLHWTEGSITGSKHFLGPSYQEHLLDWDFVARMGFRQQRSMSAVSLGIFPNEPVPVAVKPRLEDSVLGGPAPACGGKTAEMIVAWHKSTGREVVEAAWDSIAPIEKICNVSGLRQNPVNAEPGGPNPHAWIGDISDTLDSAFACKVKLPPSITPELHEHITRLAFDLEQRSHYDDPKGAIYFVGDFVNHVLKTFEAWEALPEGVERPKKTPKMRLFSCSRELMYGLQHMFDWEVTVPGQPKGRVISGSTFLWELHREQDQEDSSKSVYIVRSYWWTPSMGKLVRLQEDMLLSEFRSKYEAYINRNGGTWAKLCDFEHFNPSHNHHEPTGSGFTNQETVSKKHLQKEENAKGVVKDATKQAKNMATAPYAPASQSQEDGSSYFVSVATLAGVLVVSGAAYIFVSKRRPGSYQRV